MALRSEFWVYKHTGEQLVLVKLLEPDTGLYAFVILTDPDHFIFFCLPCRIIRLVKAVN